MSSSFHKLFGRQIINYHIGNKRFISAIQQTNDACIAINKYTTRSHTCGQLSSKEIGKRVSLCGWVRSSRFNNKIVILQDSYGATQCIINKDYWKRSIKMLDLPSAAVIQVEGLVQPRPKEQENKDLLTGEVELLVEQLTVLNLSKKDLPILLGTSSSTMNTRLKYRYLDLRSQQMQHAIRFRSKVNRILREKLYNLNFVECETPTLFSRTPGGANEFIVPTQLPDKFYSLTQSPQQLKQLLMVGGIDRYFQICRCYRDEAGRIDRQPEFTQLDIELSFTNQDLVMRMIDDLVYDLFTRVCSDIKSQSTLTSSFRNSQIKRMTFKEAFQKYGSDKPDLRFESHIESDKKGGLVLNFPFALDEGIMNDLIETTRTRAGVDSNSLEPHLYRHGDQMSLRTHRGDSAARKFLGLLRKSIAEELDRSGKSIYKSNFELVWITDFPLLEADEHGKLNPTHHPFTAPTCNTVHLLDTEPLSVVGQHYDLVLNGQEVAGGSIRIHEVELQRKIFNLLGEDENKFSYFVEALKCGCPPHGGIAFGLDRLIAIMLDINSIRDVIAFPKTGAGRDLMTDCPQEVDPGVKELYHIKVKN